MIGFPQTTIASSFEFLVFEGAQAGLSWRTILAKRESFREAFAGFDFAQRQSSGTISCTFDNLPLLAGRYGIDLTLGDGLRDLDTVIDAITFEVLPSDVFGTGKIPDSQIGVVFAPAKWNVVAAGSMPAA